MPRAFSPVGQGEQFRRGIRRSLGRIAARLPQIRGGAAAIPIDMQPATLTRLCDRKKFGMVGVRTASLSQLWGKPGTGIATKIGCSGARKYKGKAVPRGRGTPKPEF